MASIRIELHGQTVTARLEGRVIRIGRDSECDLTVDDPSVAAVHVTIEPFGSGGHKLIDANSGRPTKVNGLVVKRVSLKAGDVIDVGPARITYVVDAAASAPAARPRPAPTAAPPAPAAPRAVASSRRGATATATAVAPTRVAPTRVAPARVAAPVEAVAASPSTLVSSVATDAAAMPVASADTEPAKVPVASRSRPKRGAGLLLVGLAIFAVAALCVAYVVRNAGDDGASDLRSYRTSLDAALRLAGDDVDVALERLDDLAKPSTPVEGIRREAKREADHLRHQLESAARDFKSLETEAAELDPERTAAAYRALRDTYGPAISKRFEGALTRGATAFRDRATAKGLETASVVDALLADAKYGAASAAYDAFELENAWNEVTRAIVEDGRARVAERTGAAWKDAAAKAVELAAAKGPASAAMWLRERLPSFAGTPLARAVADRASAYDREVVSAPVVASIPKPSATAPKPTPGAPTAPSLPPGPTPSLPPVPTPSAPPAPAPALAAVAQLEGLLADAQTKVSSRKFAAALAVLDDAMKLAAGTSSAARVAGAREDTATAAEGLGLLAKTIHEHPDRFERFEMTGSFTPSLVDADDAFVDAAVPGGRTRVPWTTFDGARLTRLVDRARVPGKDALPLATLLHAVGADDAAEKALGRAVDEGADKVSADVRLARWRGEAVPAGGYVVHAGRLVSPVERDRLVLEDRVAAACAKVVAKDAAVRRAAYEELLAIGAPAQDAFVKALRSRRAAAVAEVSGNRVFTSAHLRQKLQAELEKRRAAALALIEDEKAYPYPYTEAHEGQKEVDALVDLVREVWARPFDLVATWDKNVGEALALVTEVDDVLAKADEGYAADLDAVKAAINKAIDVPGVVPDETSKKVLAYNEKVATSATPQEKENVRAVNEYRIMMGRTAVKIDERLERAARGHSIEMRLKNYFAHESPTPGLESPGKRCAREGYGGGTGENIAWGVTSGRAAFDGWFHSSGHHRNMLNKGWTEMGCGRSGPGHWTQNFGAMTGHGTKEPDALPPPRADVAPEPEGEDGMPKDAGAQGDPAMGGG